MVPLDFSTAPGESTKYHWVYIADLGKNTVEIGLTRNIRETLEEYVSKDGCKAVWTSDHQDVASVPADPRLDEVFGFQPRGWEWGHQTCVEFFSRAASDKLSETRFAGIPFDVAKCYARCIGLGGGYTNLF
ncbi:hypothetical protein ACFQZ8_00915 [Micromonospora azadirachtae]|uniref:Uncharacterized protein n=1 Tax=Micromonospora azadirachtae TaxID=1970735 RepID=A0ABW2ZV53_9ACTN